jgi:beta-galactosidase
MPVSVELVDSKGRHVPTAGNLIKFSISRNGRIIGVGNGDPNSHEPDKAEARKLYNGWAQVIIQTLPNEKGKLQLTATSEGMQSQSVEIPVITEPEVPFVPVIVADRQEIEGWRMSAASAARPDPNQKIDANDMNSWSPVKSGQLQEIGAKKYAVFRAGFTTNSGQSANTLMLRNLTGKAWLYLDGRQIAEKVGPAGSDLTVKLPSLSGNHVLSILIQAGANPNAGLGGSVTIGVMGQ